jgi:hypothetical protein
MHQMDDETFGALRVILDDYNRDDPADQIEDLERLDRAYKIVGEWYWKRALTLP